MSEVLITDSDRLKNIEWKLADIEHEVRRTRRAVPGFLSTTFGVFFGMVLYSIVGVVITALFWGFIASAFAVGLANAIQQQQARQQQGQTQPAP